MGSFLNLFLVMILAGILMGLHYLVRDFIWVIIILAPLMFLAQYLIFDEYKKLGWEKIKV